MKNNFELFTQEFQRRPNHYLLNFLTFFTIISSLSLIINNLTSEYHIVGSFASIIFNSDIGWIAFIPGVLLFSVLLYFLTDFSENSKISGKTDLAISLKLIIISFFTLFVPLYIEFNEGNQYLYIKFLSSFLLIMYEISINSQNSNHKHIINNSDEKESLNGLSGFYWLFWLPYLIFPILTKNKSNKTSQFLFAGAYFCYIFIMIVKKFPKIIPDFEIAKYFISIIGISLVFTFQFYFFVVFFSMQFTILPYIYSGTNLYYLLLILSLFSNFHIIREIVKKNNSEIENMKFIDNIKIKLDDNISKIAKDEKIKSLKCSNCEFDIVEYQDREKNYEKIDFCPACGSKISPIFENTTECTTLIHKHKELIQKLKVNKLNEGD